MIKNLICLFVLSSAFVVSASAADEFKAEACGSSEALKSQKIAEICFGKLNGKDLSLQVTNLNGAKSIHKSTNMNVQKLGSEIFISGRLSTGEKINEALKIK